MLQDELKLAKSRIDMLEQQLNHSTLNLRSEMNSALRNVRSRKEHNLNLAGSQASILDESDSDDNDDQLSNVSTTSAVKEMYSRQIDRLKDKVKKIETARSNIQEQL